MTSPSEAMYKLKYLTLFTLFIKSHTMYYTPSIDTFLSSGA